MERAKDEQARGVERVDAQGNRKKAIGRPKADAAKVAAIRERLQAGEGMTKVAKMLGVGVSTVIKVKREMARTCQ